MLSWLCGIPSPAKPVRDVAGIIENHLLAPSMQPWTKKSMRCWTTLRYRCHQFQRKILLYEPPADCSNRRWFASTAPRCRRGSKSGLPTFPARTRFAPSPTGFLHLGSLRTALFNYLLAKKTGGQFLLRIEDTDDRRTVSGAEERLCDDLQWAGLQWDEGPRVGGPCGPYKQSERTTLYHEHASKLLSSGHAYRCFCTAERLDDLARRRQEMGLPTDYDRQCFGLSRVESDQRAADGESFVVRLEAPQLYPTFMDLIYGRVGKDKGSNAGITMKYGEIAYEDPILLKTDGRPTYHLANVVDDHYMNITHVVRATEWMSSTPKHLALYDAFGWEPPSYAHVGLLVDESGHKLSKRNFDTKVASFKDDGVLPEALVNFVALLGWSHEQRKDVMTLAQLVNEFQMKFTKGNTTVTLEKLGFLQKAHASIAVQTHAGSFASMLAGVVHQVEARTDKAVLLQILGGRSLKEYATPLLEADSRNYSSAEQFVSRNLNFFQQPLWPAFSNDREDVAPTTTLHETAANFLGNRQLDWEKSESVDRSMREAIETEARKTLAGRDSDETRRQHEKAFNAAFCKYLRWVLLAGEEGPSLARSASILGREICLSRLAMCEEVQHKGQAAGA